MTAVPRLLSVVAARVGGLLNFADLSRTMGLAQTTLKRYFALLESTFIVQLLRPWTTNLGQRVIQTPKVYLNDTGLLSYLLGISVDRIETEGPLTGAALENFVLMELRKQASWSETRPEIFYRRTASGQEVDLVLEDRAGKLAGIEVKASATLSATDVRLHALASAAGKRWVRDVVFYSGTEVIPFANNLHGVPITHLWAGWEQAAKTSLSPWISRAARVFSNMRPGKCIRDYRTSRLRRVEPSRISAKIPGQAGDTRNAPIRWRA